MNRQAAKRTGTTGLLASGSSGAWELAIDESVADKPEWYAQIEGPAIDVYFAIHSPEAMVDALRFLRRLPAGEDQKAASLRIGTFGRAGVTLYRDDEFVDRCFLVIGADGKSCLRLTLAGEDLESFVEALRQVDADLGTQPTRARHKTNHR